MPWNSRLSRVKALRIQMSSAVQVVPMGEPPWVVPVPKPPGPAAQAPSSKSAWL
jgi:hypothetical protein